MDIEVPKLAVNKRFGDYEKGGILYCGSCHTPKQCWVTILGKVQLVPCMCKCEEAAEKKRRAEQEEKRRIALIEARRQMAFGDSPMMFWNFEKNEDGETKTIHYARKYVEHFGKMQEDGQGIMFFGTTGTGKTFLACCIINALIDNGYRAIATNAADISNKLLGSFEKEEIMEDLTGCDVLLLDDFGMERSTDYMMETLYNVIDGRYRKMKPTIITTNLTAKQIQEPDGIGFGRLISRIRERCICIPVTGKDRRIVNAQKKLADCMKLLDED